MVGGIQRSALLLKSLLVGRKPSPASGALRLSCAVAAIAFVSAVSGPGAAQPTPPSALAAGGGQVVWLEQNWTEEQRRRYQHQSQGTLTLPVPASWFLALQQPEDFSPTAGLFSDAAYLDRFGFIPSPRDALNPNGLPIGFARTTGNDPRNGQPYDRFGFTCAACHTGRLEHNGTTILVDGAPALINLGEFGTKLALALGETALSPPRFRRFANRVLGPGNSLGDRLRLHREVVKIVEAGLGQLLQSPSGGTEEGFGRLDALNRIGNTVFGAGLGIRRNNVATTAPVAFPHIWDTSWFAWVQYNGSIEQPMVRNAGEAMGVNAVVNYEQGPTPRFTSTIPVDRLHDPIEQSLRGEDPPLPARSFSGLRSPAWPQEILGRIDTDLAGRGAELYREVCQGCHLPAPNTDAFWTSNRWTQANAAGERYLDLNMIPISFVGTDPAQARDMANRSVWVPAALGLTGATGSDGNLRRYPFGSALGQLVELVVNRWYDANNVPQAQRDRMNGNRPNGIRAPMAYKARPLNGIWATAPYLHNGSVPTLSALLSPLRERPTRFRLGSRAFDPVNVGYVDGGGSQLDTTKAGNSNAGHLFEGPANVTPRPAGTIGRGLSPDERRALIEYLKTL